MDDKLLEAAAVGAVLEMIGPTTEDEIESFSEEAEKLASKTVSSMLAVATGSEDGENDDVAVDLQTMALMSFAADKISGFFTEQMQQMVAKQAMINMLGALGEALQD